MPMEKSGNDYNSAAEYQWTIDSKPYWKTPEKMGKGDKFRASGWVGGREI